MSNIQHLLDLIKSDSHNDRYEACEQLRVWQDPLPQEAITALNLATNDSNADVADAARRALSLHILVHGEQEQEAAENAIIYVEDGIIEWQQTTGIINISYPRREILSSFAVYTAIAMVIAIVSIILAVTDARFLSLLLVSAYFAYLAYRKILGFQKSAIEINPQAGTVRIKGKEEVQILFTNVESISVEPGAGIVLAGMARTNIVLNLKSGRNIIVASLSEDAVRVANKVEEISDLVANAIGLRRDKEEQSAG